MLGGKRELVARALFWSGAAALMRTLTERDVLLVLNYHRIGNPQDDLFDPGVFSATADQLDAQIAFLKRHFSVVSLDETLAFVGGADKSRAPRCRILITFDDGYLDNYQLAFPVLRSHGVQGVFFLATDMVGSCFVPWWDRIAYLMKTAAQRRFSLRYPAELAVDIEGNGMNRSLRDVLQLYKRPENSDSDRFMSELREVSAGSDPPATLRRFLDWQEAREMIDGKMAIGSHTHSHEVLSQLGVEGQRHQLAHSRAQFKEHLGIDVDTLAYPVGGVDCFTEQTQHVARETGYRAAFSFYGGTNARNATRPYDVRRVGVSDQSWPRFRVQASICASTGKYWP